MKVLSESKGVERLREVRSNFASRIRTLYEYKAKLCSACETPGICCRDEHFVNVRITRLEAVDIRARLAELAPEKRDEVYRRVESTIERYGLGSAIGAELGTYACPLFERGSGCLVHDTAKPLPCIAHACYENKADVPPDSLIDEGEMMVADLNRRVYREQPVLNSLPVAIMRFKRSA